jgi:hypothetical protein
MNNPAVMKPGPAGGQQADRPLEPRQTRGQPAGARKRRWFSELGRVLRFGHRPAVLPTTRVCAPVEPEPTVDPGDPDSAFDRLYELAPRLRRAWSADTSVLPESWSRERPALGQSAATVCAVQDVLGGDIVESRVVMAGGRAISHFANVVDGLVIDLAQTEVEHGTAEPGWIDRHDGFASMRTFVLAQPGADIRYAALKSRLAEIAGSAR